jgi:uncharacterized protein with FMN-binding domain
MTSSHGTRGRRVVGFTGLLAGIGLLVAGKAATAQPVHRLIELAPQARTPPTASAQPAPTGAAPTGSTPPSSSLSSPAPVVTGRHTVQGSLVDMPYGPVQVAVVFDSGKIVDVQNVQMPTDQDRSIRIAEIATPILRQEVLSAQSTQIDSVSGATYTSEAYAESVQYAIDHQNG